MPENSRRIKTIQLDSIPSTNAFLKELLQHESVDDLTLITTEEQTQGRGQMGASWSSQKGRNIALSFFKVFKNIEVGQQFSISMAVSLAVYDTLKHFSIPKIQVKWPNDILVEGKKLSGILIETTLSGTQIHSAIIGIGLNVNQSSFPGLPHAQSMIQLLGKPTDRKEIIEVLVQKLIERLESISLRSDSELKNSYESLLFKKGVVALYKSTEFGICNGIIQGVNDKGQLVVELENHGQQSFNLKEIEFLTN